MSAVANIKAFSLLPWSSYFCSHRFIEFENGDTFSVYLDQSQGENLPVILAIHGAGFSALSWCLFAKAILLRVKCQILAIDLRNHGETKCADHDYSLDKMALDVGRIYRKIFDEQSPVTILLGHSMGGALATRLSMQSENNCDDSYINAAALIVVDVVEGTTMTALSSMRQIVQERPKQFPSYENAVEWAMRSGYIRNRTSARISMAGQVKSETLSAENNQDPTLKWVWRADLLQTEPYWRNWFEDLSQRFLNCKPAKLLVLAGVDRLDTALTCGHMQGRFQMHLMQKSGHVIHEDQSDSFANIVAQFLIRHKLVEKLGSFTVTLVPSC